MQHFRTLHLAISHFSSPHFMHSLPCSLLFIAAFSTSLPSSNRPKPVTRGEFLHLLLLSLLLLLLLLSFWSCVSQTPLHRSSIKLFDFTDLTMTNGTRSHRGPAGPTHPPTALLKGALIHRLTSGHFFAANTRSRM